MPARSPTLEVLRSHSSCRDYTTEPVPDDVLGDILRAAQQAPTDATGQLYSILRVKDPRLRSEFARLCGGQTFIADAPEAFVVLLDTRRLRLLLESRGETYGMRPLVALLFGLTDAALFAQSFVIAAESLGYGTCYLGSVQNNARAIATLLHIPPGVVPLYGLTMGKPASRSPPKPRTPTRHVLHTDRYRDPAPADLDEIFATMASATRSGDWVNPIRKYFAKGGIMDGREAEFYQLLCDQGFPLGPPD
ncbi:MAG TPA: nitroreductase family protein [Candidatus Thermoplasmatota archaeon]|nr:nitroreductase family protein [Candidatus Thermoplasmatota archaeon]